MKSKQEIRQTVRRLKQSMPAGSRLQQSYHIVSLLEMHERFQKAHVVLAYYPLPDEPAIESHFDVWARHKVVLLPVVQGDRLLLRRYEGRDSLREGAFHILEPVGELFTDYSSIDLVLVPGVAFDAGLHRLGRGKGYYDRLLSGSDFGSAYKLGVCFRFQILDAVPVEAFDVRMDEVLGCP